VVCAQFVVLGFGAESMSPIVLSVFLGTVSLFMGTVMAVVQATVQSETPMALLGTSTAMISLSRALGGAVGTALVGALFFALMAAGGMKISTELQAVLQGSSDDLTILGQAAEADIRLKVAIAFRAVFFLIAGYAAVGSLLAWTLPRRTL
jgi:hypothetical protein